VIAKQNTVGYEGGMTTVGGNDAGDGYNYKGEGEGSVVEDGKG